MWTIECSVGRIRWDRKAESPTLAGAITWVNENLDVGIVSAFAYLNGTDYVKEEALGQILNPHQGLEDLGESRFWRIRWAG
jgi:hypothetical protein